MAKITWSNVLYTGDIRLHGEEPDTAAIVVFEPKSESGTGK